MIASRRPQAAFTVTADRAKNYGSREHAYFSGHVAANREPDAPATTNGREPAGALTLTTDTCTSFPRRNAPRRTGR